MNILSTKTNKIFFQKNIKYNNLNKVDLILSPDFYWVRSFDVDIKTLSQAKSIAPTLFEDILDSNLEYSYKVIKLNNDKYLYFAYDNKEILENIKNSGLNINLINSVYFAQTELEVLNKFNSLDESFFYTDKNILVKLPRSFNQNFFNLEDKLNNINLSSNKVDMKFYNNIISNKQINILSIIFICFILGNLIVMYKTNLRINKIYIEKSNFIDTKSIPTSEIQLNSIVNNYKNNISNELKKRKIYKFLSDNNDLNIEEFVIKNKTIEFKFKNIRLLNKVKKFTKNYNAKIDPKTKYIDVRIQL